jgi:hypothetical protein
VLCAPLHLLFWQDRDVSSATGVHFEARPFPKESRRFLLPTGPEHPTLWYSPSDIIPAQEGFRLYYQRIEKDQKESVDQRAWCMGLLDLDGSFRLPELHLFPGRPIELANAVLQRSPHKPAWGGFNVFQMVGDQESGFRLLYWDQPEAGEAGGLIAESTDGLHWRKDESKAVFTEHNDAFSLLADPFREGYLLYQTRLADWPEKPVRDNLPGLRRVISLRRSTDLHHWSPQEDVLVPDAEDAPECEFYLMKAFRYGGRFAGLLMKYYADPEKAGKHSAIYRNELIFSEDGVRWERPFRETDMGVWSYVTPFDLGGRLSVAAYDPGGLALFQTRRDGLAACGSKEAGAFRTAVFEVPTNPISLNLESGQGGMVEVEILDASGAVMPGYEGRNCRLTGVNSVDQALSWGKRDLSGLAGQRVSVEFRLREAWIYSLRERE